MDQNKLETPQLYKGVVLECDDTETVVLGDNGDVLKLHAKGSLDIGQQVYFFEEDIYREKPALVTFPQMRKAIIGLGLAAAMLILFVVKWPLTPSVAAVVSIDINPSVELSLDAKGFVISAEALNQDAVKLMQGIKVRGKTSVQAVEMIVLQAQASGYETAQQSVLLAFAPTGSFDAELTEIAGSLELLSKSNDYVFLLSKQAVTIPDGAHLSLGRTLLGEQYKAMDQEVISHATIQKIFEMIKAQEEEVELEPKEELEEVDEPDAGESSENLEHETETETETDDDVDDETDHETDDETDHETDDESDHDTEDETDDE